MSDILLFLVVMGAILFGAWVEGDWHPGSYFEDALNEFRGWRARKRTPPPTEGRR